MDIRTIFIFGTTHLLHTTMESIGGSSMANIRNDQTNLEKIRRMKGMTRQNLADATGHTWNKLRSYEIKRSSI